MLICTECGWNHPIEGLDIECLSCGGLLRLEAGPVFDPEQVGGPLGGIWRYRHTFPFGRSVAPCTLGEGATPLIEGRVGDRPVHFKLEQLNPTGSFKDRGTSVLVSLMASRDVTSVVEDSSGNAGASLAAYSGRAGMRARIFCPSTVSLAKLKQVEAHGAELVRVEGPRIEATKAAVRAAGEGANYASHVRSPVGLAGMATAAFEIWEQLGRTPDAVVVPVGQGTLLLGLHRGFTCLRSSGMTTLLPRLIGVQAARCAPLAAPRASDSAHAVESARPTLAEGISIPNPLRSREVLAAVAESGGMILTATEDNIRRGVEALALQGLYVEATSAVVWSGLTQLLVSHSLGTIVAVLTGHGLKISGATTEPS